MCRGTDAEYSRIHHQFQQHQFTVANKTKNKKLGTSHQTRKLHSVARTQNRIQCTKSHGNFVSKRTQVKHDENVKHDAKNTMTR